MDKPPPQTTPLEVDIIRLYDDLIEFNDRCSFLCEAFSCLLSEDEVMDKSTIMGFRHYCFWIKHKSETFTRDIAEIKKKSSRKGDIVPLKR